MSPSSPRARSATRWLFVAVVAALLSVGPASAESSTPGAVGPDKPVHTQPCRVLGMPRSKPVEHRGPGMTLTVRVPRTTCNS